MELRAELRRNSKKIPRTVRTEKKILEENEPRVDGAHSTPEIIMSNNISVLTQQYHAAEAALKNALFAEFLKAHPSANVSTLVPSLQAVNLDQPASALGRETKAAPKTKGKRNDVTGILSKILLAGGDFKPKELVEKSGLKSTSVSAWLNTEKNKEGGIVKWNEEAGTYSAASSTPAAKTPAKAKAKAKAKPKAGKAKVSKKKA